MMSITAPDGLDIGISNMECRIRPYRANDVAALQRTADDILVARYMYAGFPHPFTLRDAVRWVQHAMTDDPLQHFVIDVDGQSAGAVSLAPGDSTFAGIGIIGYWLTAAYWGRGIATAAVRRIVEHAFANEFRRLQASAYEANIGSVRVLEKCGLMMTSVCRKAISGWGSSSSCANIDV